MRWAVLLWRAAVPLLALPSFVLLAAAAPSGQESGAGDPWQAVTVVTGTDMRSRPVGLAACLREA